MKKYLKILTILTFLFFNMQVFGQGYTGNDGWEDSAFRNMQKIPSHVTMQFINCNLGGGTGGGGTSGGGGGTTINRTLMTYNIKRWHYGKNGDIIKSAGAHVCAVQEIVKGGISCKWSKLKNRAGMDGEFCWTMHFGIYTYGIGLLYKTSVVGSPSQVIEERVDTSSPNIFEDDTNRAFIIAEFSNFIFASTHVGGNNEDKTKIINRMFNKINLNSTKRIFIAGDMNFQPKDSNTLNELFTEKNFEVLNSEALDPENNNFYHPNHQTTYKTKKMIDLIYGKKHIPMKYEVTWRGIPSTTPSVSSNLSDHKPYVVKVKFQ